MVDYKIITKHTVIPPHLNMHSNLFGGVMLSWLDEAGYLYAVEICRSTNIVTVAMNNIVFKSPVRLGDIVTFYGKLLKIGKTSITIKLKAEIFSVINSNSSSNNPVIECEIVFVKVDENGIPINI